MAKSSQSILILTTFDQTFLANVYHRHPTLAEMDYACQRQHLFDTGFGLGDAYSVGLRALGWDAQEIIVNADPLQMRWAQERDLSLDENPSTRRRQVVAAQVAHHRPDVLFVFEWFPFGDDFLRKIKRFSRLAVGQIASTLQPTRTYDAYDLMLSSLQPIVDYFRAKGKPAEYLRLGFDERVSARLATADPKYDITFVGGLGPSHTTRIAWLEHIASELDVAIFGYGVDSVAPESPIRACHRGPVWGWEQYEVLSRSRVTLNLHADVDVRGTIATESWANNMRLYEATGVGTCLVTDWKENLPELFDPNQEVVTFQSPSECVTAIQELLANPERRNSIARAGFDRTRRDHTYALRTKQLSQIIENV